MYEPRVPVCPWATVVRRPWPGRELNKPPMLPRLRQTEVRRRMRVKSMTHRLEGGGPCNGLEVLIPAKAGMMIPAPSGLQEVDGLNRLL
jgi:hypothetical protein